MYFGFVAPEIAMGAAFMTNGLFASPQDVYFFRGRTVPAIVDDLVAA